MKEDGTKVKVTKRVRVQKVTKRVSKTVLERRAWPKFGGSAGLKPGESDQGITAQSVEEIFLERVRTQSKSEVEKLGDNPLAAAAAANASLLVCRICGKKGDHWTSKCPYKDLAASKGITVGEKLDEGAPPGGGSGGGDVRKGGYVPPSMRAGAKGESMGDSMRKPRDENSVRVTNLSEDTREADLQELFRPFGAISRVYVAFNRETGESRGFAFVNFLAREDAQRAINKLDGYGYDNLILRVEWAAPREEVRRSHHGAVYCLFICYGTHATRRCRVRRRSRERGDGPLSAAVQSHAVCGRGDGRGGCQRACSVACSLARAQHTRRPYF